MTPANADLGDLEIHKAESLFRAANLDDLSVARLSAPGASSPAHAPAVTTSDLA